MVEIKKVIDLKNGIKFDSSIVSIHDNIIIIRKEKKYGIVSLNSKNGQICTLIEPQYYRIKPIENGFFQTQNFEWDYGLINSNGKEVLMPIYDEIEFLNDHLIRIRKDDQYGIVNTAGEEVLKPNYHFISIIKDDIITASQDNKSFAYDNNGKLLFEIDGWLDDFRDGYSIYGDRIGKRGIIDSKGKLLTEKKYDTIYNLGFGIFYTSEVIKNKNFMYRLRKKDYDHTGILNIKTGKEILVHVPNNAEVIDDNRLLLHRSGEKKQRIYDFDGNFIHSVSSNCKYEYGLGIVRDNKPLYDTKHKEFVLNSDGQIINDQNYNQIVYLDDKFLRVCVEPSYGLLHRDGVIILEPIYDSIEKITDDLILFSRIVNTMIGKTELYGLVNQEGKVVVKSLYESIYRTGNRIIVRDHAHRCTVCDLNGKALFETKYRYIRSDQEGIYACYKESTTDLMDENGKVIFKPNRYFTDYEIKDGLVLIFNSNLSEQGFSLYDQSGNEIFINQDFKSAHIINKNQIILDNVLLNISDMKYKFKIELDNQKYIFETEDECNQFYEGYSKNKKQQFLESEKLKKLLLDLLNHPTEKLIEQYDESESPAVQDIISEILRCKKEEEEQVKQLKQKSLEKVLKKVEEHVRGKQ